MGHVPSPPFGPTGPFRGAVRRVATYRTSQPGWASLAIDDLMDRRDVVVDNVLIQGRSLNPRASVWMQLRQRLAERGIRTPREVPDDG
jgi:hypothetical protein